MYPNWNITLFSLFPETSSFSGFLRQFPPPNFQEADPFPQLKKQPKACLVLPFSRPLDGPGGRGQPPCTVSGLHTASRAPATAMLARAQAGEANAAAPLRFPSHPALPTCEGWGMQQLCGPLVWVAHTSLANHSGSILTHGSFLFFFFFHNSWKNIENFIWQSSKL